MEPEIEVLRHGTEVIIDGNIKAFILSVEIRGSTISYQCCWWDGRTRKTEWVTQGEVRPAGEAKSTQIKFI